MNINLKPIDMKNMFFKGLFALLLLAGTTALAQTTNAGDNVAQGDAAGVSVKLIDNKGTIKYLQSNNGITTITSTEANNLTTTTWQLGGSLLEDTYIDVNGNVFAFDGIELVDPATLAASTNATTGSDHGTGSGWTILVRDEATGAVKKLKATDLIQSGQTVFTASVADASAGATPTELTFDVASATAATPQMTGAQIPLPDFDKVWVYRNGAKLLAGVDYTISPTNTSAIVLDETPSIGDSWTLYNGDIIEVQYFK